MAQIIMHFNQVRSPSPRFTTGLSLLEVLVSLFLLCTGALGVIKLQLVTQQTVRETRSYDAGMHLAFEMATQVRELPYQQTLQQQVAQILESQQTNSSLLPHLRMQLCRDSTPWDNDRQTLRWECLTDSHAGSILKLGWSDTEDESVPPKIALSIPAQTVP